jgi:hypothetical protein
MTWRSESQESQIENARIFVIQYPVMGWRAAADVP